MKRDEYELWEGVMVSRVSVPPSGRRAPRCRHEVIIGWDTEFIQEPRQLLSVQFAAEVDGRLVSQVYQPMAPSMTPAALLAYVRAFVAWAGIDVPLVNGLRRVTLVAHFNAAELGTFEDAIRDLTVRRVGRAHHAQTDILQAEDGPWRVELVDLFGFFPTSLKALGEYVGLPKLEIDVANIAQAMAEQRDLFLAYAARDAEIAYLAYTGFRQTVLEKYGVDVLFHPSLAAVAGEAFKWGFLKTAPAPYRTIYEPDRRKRRNGTWTDGRRAVRIFDGSRDARIDHLRAMHGGRNEAFTVGLYDHPVAEWDVVSMYPASALIQPLPDEKTKIRRVEKIADLMKMEGAGLFAFRFPPEELYPCLPVRQPGRDRLLFTTSGTSYATFAEVREALDIGATIEILSAYGFLPTHRELEHEVARFIRAAWKEKLEAPKGSLQYLVAKEILNAALGKLAQRTRSSNLLDLEREARQEGLGGAGALIAANPSLRDALRSAPSLGGLWSPERLTLITGRSRALMSQIVRRSGAHLISTDAIIADADAPVDCPAVNLLRGVGSDLKLEKSADAALFVRSRMYALLRRAGHVQPGERVIATDDTWAVIKGARQGTGEPEESFAHSVLACLRAGRDIEPNWTKKKLLSVEEAIRLGRRIGDEVTQTGTTRFRWDTKRRLADRDCAIFRRTTTTTPYESEQRRDGAVRAVQVRRGTARRRTRPISTRRRERIIELLRAGVGVREVARQLKVAAATVSAIRAELGLGTTGGTP
jgi:hypothetical protein